MPLSTSIFIDIACSYSSSNFDLQLPTADMRIAHQVNLSSGSGANAADRLWSDTRTALASATDSLDMAGALTDAFGVPYTPVRIKFKNEQN